MVSQEVVDGLPYPGNVRFRIGSVFFATGHFVGSENGSRAFDGQVLVVHGDSHEFLFDHPLLDSETQDTLENFTRLETFGSPDVGWVHVIVDTLATDLVTVRPYLCQGRWYPLIWLGLRKPGHCILQAR